MKGKGKGAFNAYAGYGGAPVSMAAPMVQPPTTNQFAEVVDLSVRPSWVPDDAKLVSMGGQTGWFITQQTALQMDAEMQGGFAGPAMGGAGRKRAASEAMNGFVMPAPKGAGKGGKAAPFTFKYPKPDIPNPGLDPDQPVFNGKMKGRPNPQTGYSFIQCDEVSMLYPGRDVYLHCKLCPWVECMGLEKDHLVQFQYGEKDGAPVVSRIIRLEEAE